jgi:hypothetical protein
MISTLVLAQHDDLSRVKVFSNDPVSLIQELERSNHDVLGINRREGFVEILADQKEIRTLESAGHEVEVLSFTTRAVPSGYHDYDAFVTLYQDLAASYPHIAKLVDVGAEMGTGNTYESRKLYAMKISDNVDDDEDEINIWIVGNHHAREITTGEYDYWIAEKLLKGYMFNANIKKWVDNNQIYIGMTWNPDGLEYCHNTYGYWRKNRKPFVGGDVGVDLNRNFDIDWDGPGGGSTDPSSDTYRGPSPNSEAETQAEVAWGADRHFAKVLDFHSYGSEVLYTYYSSSDFPTLLENWFRGRAIALAAACNYGGNYRKPSAMGEHYEYQLANLGAFAFLIETGLEFQPAFATAQSEFNDHIWPGVQWFLDHEIPLRGHVTEAVTGDPIEAEMAITGVTYKMGETRKSEPRFGRYHYHLPPGTHEITFSAPGYAPRTFDVTVAADESTLLEVQLGPGPTLTVNGPAAQGEHLDLDFDWPSGPGEIYFNGLSFGTTGFNFKNGVHVPLDWDILYQLTLGAVPGWVGYLDGSGHADAILPIPHNNLILGLTVYMGYFTLEAGTNTPLAASAAVNITFDP